MYGNIKEKGESEDMKKFLCVFIALAICLTCFTGMTACHFDSNVNLEEDSQVKAVTVKYADGTEIELGKEDIEVVIGDLKKNLDKFQSDSKILVNKRWEYEYDYVLKIKAVRRVMLSKKDITLEYRFGTTGIYTDSNGKKSQTRYDNEWTHLIAGARWICNTEQAGADAIRARLDALKAQYDVAQKEVYEEKYGEMINLFEKRAFTVRELEQHELSYLADPETDEYIWLNAEKGFEAADTVNGDRYIVYWSNEEDVKEAFLHFGREFSIMQGVFFGYSYSSYTTPLTEVFAEVFADTDNN